MPRAFRKIALGASATLAPTAPAAETLPGPSWGALAATGQYGFLIGVLAVLLVITFAIRNYVWSFYALLGMAGCLWVAMNEQGAVGLFVGGFAIPFHLYMGATHVMIAALFAQAAYTCPANGWRRHMRPVFALFVVINLILVFANGLLPRGAALQLTSVLMMLGIAALAVPVSALVTLSGQSNRLARWGAIVLAVLTVLIYANSLAGFSAVHPALLNRWFLTLLILFGTLICLIRVFALQRDRERKLVEVAQAAEREAAINKALLETERNYAEAREVARTRTQDLARASHDIKQPLISLRRNLDIVGRDQPENLRRQLSEAFEYLDHLTNSYLRNTALAETAPEGSAPEAAQPVGTLLDTLDRMFRQEAEAKGLQFDVRPSDARLSAPPLIVMRILSNLVSNAIRHTDKGKIILETEQALGAVCIVVRNSHADAERIDFEALFAEGNKGGASKGSGLGLAIAREEAANIGMTLRVAIDPQSETPVQFRLSEQQPD